MKGRWAAGIEPRGFQWVFRDVFAVSERPGGSTMVHRRVRRDEELLWLKHQGFVKIISLFPETQNLAIYGENGLLAAQYPLRTGPLQSDTLLQCYLDLQRCMDARQKVLVHSDEVSDRILGVVAGYLVWSQKVGNAPAAVALVERLFKRSVGPEGRAVLLDVPEPVTDA